MNKNDRLNSKLNKFCHQENINREQFKKWFIKTYIPDIELEVQDRLREMGKITATIDTLPENYKNNHSIKILLEV